MRRVLVVATLGIAGLLAMEGVAAAQAWPFGCRASAARVAAPQADVTVEPVRANADLHPCTSQSASTVEPMTIQNLSADAVGAFTARGDVAGGAALGSIAHAAVRLGTLDVRATSAEATATTGCTGTTPFNTGGSKVVELFVNGQVIALPPGNATVERDLGPAGKIILNEELVEGSVLTRRAIHVITPEGEAVLAEAVVGYEAAACLPPAETLTTTGGGGDATKGGGAGSGGGGGGGGSGGTATNSGPSPCPQGSTYDPSRNVCVIREGASTVVIGRPFEGPSGGSVLTLGEARRRYKSGCLKGRGENFVIVGTNGRDNITGTNGHDRILLLAGTDKAEGGRGDDCIDGGRGRDTMSGALGRDRLIGGTGGDHLIGGSHVDRLSGGNGNDTINTGFGKDSVTGGPGRDRINAATAGPAARRLNCGAGRDKIRINRNERRKVRGCEIVHRIR